MVGGASEDKVSVHHGFRGCMQVGGGGGGGVGGACPSQAAPRLPVPLLVPLVTLLAFSE